MQAQMQAQQQVCNCTHCTSFRAAGANGKGAAVIVLLNHNKHGPVMGGGRERDGKKDVKGRYNLAAGKNDNPGDNGCMLRAATRELCEEYGFSVQQFNTWWKGEFVVHSGTVVLVLRLPNGQTSGDRCAYMKLQMSSPTAKWCEQEMDDFTWFRMDNGKQVDGANKHLTSFADAARRKC